MVHEYFLEVEIENEWEDISVVPFNYLNEKDKNFIVDEVNKNILSDYLHKPIRLRRMIVDENLTDILGQEIIEFRVWGLHKNEVVAINPNQNYKKYKEQV